MKKIINGKKYDTETAKEVGTWSNGRTFRRSGRITMRIKEKLVDKIASFFEQEENWNELKKCWIVAGYSEDLRRLLRKAMEEIF